MALGVLLGIITGISLDGITNTKTTVITTVEAKEEVEAIVVPVEVLPIEPKEVQIEVVYDWTKERIIKEIEATFPEDPKTAVKIAICESNLKIGIQSHHIGADGQQERSFGIFQIHAPSWHKTAMRLGYVNYQTDVLDNLKMARYIYDNADQNWRDWSCFSKRMI